MATYDPLAGIPDESARRVVQVDPLRAAGLVQIGQQQVNPVYSAEVTNALAAQQQSQQNTLMAALAARQAQPAAAEEEAAAAAAAAPTTAELQNIASKNRGFGAVSDTFLAFGAGLGQLVGTVGDLASLIGVTDPDNAVSSFGRDVAEGFRGAQTEELQARRALRDQAIEAADGVGGEFAAALIGTIGTPSLLIDLIAETAPSLVGSVGAGALARVGVRGLTARQGLQKAAADRIANAAGVSGAVATAAVEQGASVGGETFEGVMGMDNEVWAVNPEYLALRAEGVDEKEAKETVALRRAREAFAGATTFSLGVQALPGARILERSLLRVPRAELAKPGNMFQRIGQSGIGRFATGAAGEGFSEGFEEGGGRYLGGLAQQRVDPSVDPLAGVGGAAGLGFAPGAGVGGGVNVVAGRRPREEAETDADADPGTDEGTVEGPEQLAIPDAAGLDSEVEITIPTGMAALDPRAQQGLRTAVRSAVNAINARLAKAKVPQVDEVGNEVTTASGEFMPMAFTVDQFLADPERAINLASDAGVSVEELVTARDRVMSDFHAAEQKLQLDTMLDEATHTLVKGLGEAGRRSVAEAMGWDFDALEAALRAAPQGNVESQPLAAKQALAGAAVDALYSERRGAEAAREELALAEFEAARAEAQTARVAAREAEALRREAEAAEILGEAETEEQAAQQTAQQWLSGQPAEAPADPLQRAAQLTAATNAFLTAPAVRDFNPAAVSLPSLRNPLLNGNLRAAHSRGDAEAVRTILRQSREQDAPAKLRRFNDAVRRASQEAEGPKE